MGILWKLIKWIWTTVTDAVRMVLISGVVVGVAFVVITFRDKLMELWHRVVS